MEKYVVSRELAQKLKEAGYPQSTSFVWARPDDYNGIAYADTVVFAHPNWRQHVVAKGWAQYEHVAKAAPMSDELLEQLPPGVFIAKGKRYRVWNDDANGFTWEDSEKADPIDADKTADALAQLWLWCKENGHLHE